jgi:hypothetical protein
MFAKRFISILATSSIMCSLPDFRCSAFSQGVYVWWSQHCDFILTIVIVKSMWN